MPFRVTKWVRSGEKRRPTMPQGATAKKSSLTEPIPCIAIAMEQDSPTSESDKACGAEEFDEIDTSVCGTIPSCTTRGVWSPPQGKPRLELSSITERRVNVPPSFNNLVIHFPKGLPVLPFSGTSTPSTAGKTSVASLLEYMACLKGVLVPHRKSETTKIDELHEAESNKSPDTYQGPKEVNSEECHSECNEANSFQPTAKVQVVHGSSQAQPAGDGGQRGDEQEAHHVPKESPLLVLGARVPQPLHRHNTSKAGVSTGRMLYSQLKAQIHPFED
ncbi:hypothetical protein DV515_00014520 [Chloebia gouldiae]|uniref:Uncharacterized protein n=1 Tax=Chloebia gouldiae TaxID=44316 RepID=A0A3L8RZ26_CHLGU|nr:hypothetical protein DV515_00014520 [Chloebia gouldiae]